MLGRSILILAVLAATIALTARSSLSETTACRTDPGAPAPQGLHWYYRVDRTGNRHCWFLDSTGTPVPLHKDLATSNLRSQVTAEQVLASPENDTVPTAPAQRATPETVAAETTAQEPSVRGRAATDFTARWFDLPKSVDLDAREFAVPRQTDAAGHTAPDSDEQIPSTWFVAADTGGGLRDNPARTPKFGSIFLAGALGILLFGGVFRLTSAWRDHPRTPNDLAYEPEMSLAELMRVLRRADEALELAQGRVTEILTDRRTSNLSPGAHSALRSFGRDRITGGLRDIRSPPLIQV